MAEEKLIGWGEIVRTINAQLEKPLSRQFLAARVAPVMEAAGDLKRLPRDSGMTAEKLGRWAKYIAYRQRKVLVGEWSRTRAYSVKEMEHVLAELEAEGGKPDGVD